jgi:hypothetical protein
MGTSGGTLGALRAIAVVPALISGALAVAVAPVGAASPWSIASSPSPSGRRAEDVGCLLYRRADRTERGVVPGGEPVRGRGQLGDSRTLERAPSGRLLRSPHRPPTACGKASHARARRRGLLPRPPAGIEQLDEFARTSPQPDAGNPAHRTLGRHHVVDRGGATAAPPATGTWLFGVTGTDQTGCIAVGAGWEAPPPSRTTPTRHSPRTRTRSWNETPDGNSDRV